MPTSYGVLGFGALNDAIGFNDNARHARHLVCRPVTPLTIAPAFLSPNKLEQSC